MRRGLIAAGIVVGLLLLLALPIFGSYNGLVRKEQAVDEQWAQVQTQYQRRFDLIPNLVESTKAFLQQERDIFELITQARTRYAGASNVDEQAQAAGQLESALARLLVIVESNPQIQSNQTIADLMTQLEGTENRVATERRRYNQVVNEYNTSIRTFPSNMAAGLFGFEKRSFFESVTGADQAPKVEF